MADKIYGTDFYRRRADAEASARIAKAVKQGKRNRKEWYRRAKAVLNDDNGQLAIRLIMRGMQEQTHG